jgi:ethanolamine utilization protein EutP
MLWGGIGAGKTTLLRALEGNLAPARKTQMIDYAGYGIDTPGEYSEMGNFRRHLIATASDAQLLVVVQDATRPQSNFPPKFFLMFSQPTIGVVTKIDAPAADAERAAAALRQSGVTGEIFCVSSITGSGLSSLRQNLLSYSSSRKE